jgi:hypothetical protein
LIITSILTAITTRCRIGLLREQSRGPHLALHRWQ